MRLKFNRPKNGYMKISRFTVCTVYPQNTYVQYVHIYILCSVYIQYVCTEYVQNMYRICTVYVQFMSICKVCIIEAVDSISRDELDSP